MHAWRQGDTAVPCTQPSRTTRQQTPDENTTQNKQQQVNPSQRRDTVRGEAEGVRHTRLRSARHTRTAAQHSTAQHSTAQHSTAQLHMAQRGKIHTGCGMDGSGTCVRCGAVDTFRDTVTTAPKVQRRRHRHTVPTRPTHTQGQANTPKPHQTKLNTHTQQPASTVQCLAGYKRQIHPPLPMNPESCNRRHSPCWM